MGLISFANKSACRYNANASGKFESKVKIKIPNGGTAIKKLNEMAATRSFIPICLVCIMKKCITSYNGNPSKPGNEILFEVLSNQSITGCFNMFLKCFIKLALFY
jgi:hypothetical protein